MTSLTYRHSRGYCLDGGPQVKRLRKLPPHVALLRRAFPRADLDVFRDRRGWFVFVYFWGQGRVLHSGKGRRSLYDAVRAVIARRRKERAR